jgi:hypothetical protein
MRKRAFILMAVIAGMAGATALSAQITTQFRAERARLEAAFNLKGQTEGEVLRNRMINPFATPGIRIQKVLPGSALTVAVRGNFPAGTAILSERDGVTLSGASLSTTTYSAHVTIPPDEAPGFVRLWAFNPIGIEGPTAVALVDTFYRFDLKSPNGYTVKIVPIEKTFTMEGNKRAHVKYQAKFYKPGESRPFETVTGNQEFSVADAPLESHTPYARLEISFDQSTTSPQAELEEINEKLSNPKTTEAQRNALMARMGALQTKMLEEMTKALKNDPASLNKTQDDFGCGFMQLYPSRSGAVEGSFSCGQNFSDGVLRVTGTMTRVQ